MILAPVTDPFLRSTVRRAAYPDEDVFWRPGDVLEAVRLGFPRLGICTRGWEGGDDDAEELLGEDLPLLAVTPATVGAWDRERESVGFAVRRVDDHARRLRSLMNEAAGSPGWVDAVFRDLGRMAGARVPRGLRGFGRRVLEFPSRYGDLHDVSRLSGITRGALKGRFRRRDLPSPAVYLRWFRVVAATHILSDPETTTEEAAFRLGLHSSGNLCRFVQDVSGLTPTEVRSPEGRIRVLTGFVKECLGRSEMERWDDLAGLFVRGIA